MFFMSRFWERVFYLLTFIAIGPYFFNPKAYAVMHRMHHAYSDTEDDPHAPQYFRNVFSLLWGTIKVYLAIDARKIKPKNNFERSCPEWESFDNLTNNWLVRCFMLSLILLIYYYFATAWWMYLLLPIHAIMGGIHGTIVNWYGHRHGYINFADIEDHSKNTLPFDFITGGELLQNNHHKFPSRANFAVRLFELDPTYSIIKLLGWLGIVRFSRLENVG